MLPKLPTPLRRGVLFLIPESVGGGEWKVVGSFELAVKGALGG